MFESLRVFGCARLCAIGAIAAGALVVSGCSDPSDEPNEGGALDDGQKLSSLSDAQLGALCDWSNQQQGGYGKQVKCASGGTIMTQTDQASCKAEDGPTLKKCDQTVAVYKACTLRLVQDPCLNSEAYASDACRPLVPCLL